MDIKHKIHVGNTEEILSSMVCNWLLAQNIRLNEKDKSNNFFSVALSGGDTPVPIYKKLCDYSENEDMKWSNWHIWWNGEKVGLHNNENSNYKKALDYFLQDVPIPYSQIHPVPFKQSPQDSARIYQEDIVEMFSPDPPSFDVILLTMGSDGHIASLFPGSEGMRDDESLILANWISKLNEYRITFSLKLIRKAKEVAILVTDHNGARLIEQIVTRGYKNEKIPASIIYGSDFSVNWFITAEVAGMARLLEPSSVFQRLRRR
tara:strand:- start:7811 stop:8596 length:786 start_codon:yes stop_codon:yes gene_type:complete